LTIEKWPDQAIGVLAPIEESCRMRKAGIRRLVAGVSASTIGLAGLVSLSGLQASAGADTASGVGTSQVSTTVLGVQIGSAGSLLNLRVLGDDANSTID